MGVEDLLAAVAEAADRPPEGACVLCWKPADPASPDVLTDDELGSAHVSCIHDEKEGEG